AATIAFQRSCWASSRARHSRTTSRVRRSRSEPPLVEHRKREAMFIAKKHIPRRAFLRGTGVTLALPLLDAMVPAATLLAQTAATPKPRFIANFIPHGMSPGYWVPETVGAGFKMPPVFEPLEPFRKQTVILSGLHARS